MIDDSVHHRVVGEERDDLHQAAALGTEERINFINLAACAVQSSYGIVNCDDVKEK